MDKNSTAFQTVCVEHGNTGKGEVIVGRIQSGSGKAFSAFFKIIRRKNILGNEKSNDYMYTESVISISALGRNQLPHANTLPSSHPP